jgi:Na+-translocating ferredoxin:NAD+ oxidoreductase RNF subunit RnfB
LKPLVEIIDQKCKLCYACVRACPVNAIQVRSEQAIPKIMPNRCIGCGSCIQVCAPEAIVYRDSKEETKALLKSGIPVIALVDPAISGEFPDIVDYRKFVQMIRSLGFSHVCEVSFGVDLIAKEYSRLFSDFKGKYYIMANCPVVIGYIEKFQPELIPNLAPLVSPAIATAKVVRSKYGNDLKTVYIGPVIASKKESEMGEGDGMINSSLTFLELRELFAENNIDEKQLEFSDFDPPFGYTGDLFPIANGILQAAGLSEDLLTGNITTVEGEREMKDSLRQFQDKGDIINSHFNIFYTEFLMGPGTSKKGKKYIRRASVKTYSKKRLKKFNHANWEKELKEYSHLDFSRKFSNDDQRLYPSEEKVQKILDDLRQDGRDDMGCGACGYGSCREFAIAIAKGLATPEMCNIYTNRNRQNYIQSLKVSNDKLSQAEKALRESEQITRKEKEAAKEASEITTAMLQKLPSAIVILDEKLKILQANETFIQMLGDEAREINEIIPGLVGADLKTLLPYNFYNLFSYVLINNENIQNRDITFGDKLLNLSAFMIRKGKIVGGVVRDMGAPEVRKEEVIKRVTEAIDKNLSQVQQIAFLLGEGASETERMLHSIIEFYKTNPRKEKP